jgi:uncharacterized membrane-anchored protein
MSTSTPGENALSKVPQVTFVFWLIKIAATTLGETGGDAISMSLNLGAGLSTAILVVPFLVFLFIQIKAARFYSGLYWVTIIATTMLGTTLADYCDRNLHIGYAGGSSLLSVFLITSLVAWRCTLGSVSINTVSTPKAEIFYWVTIMFSQTLGTALGDWTADTEGFGFLNSTMLFGILLAIIAGLYFFTKINRTALFWSAFVLTRPLGAVLGDYFDKPVSQGGLNLSRFTASAVLIVFIIVCILIFPQRAAKKAGH